MGRRPRLANEMSVNEIRMEVHVGRYDTNDNGSSEKTDTDIHFDAGFFLNSQRFRINGSINPLIKHLEIVLSSVDIFFPQALQYLLQRRRRNNFSVVGPCCNSISITSFPSKARMEILFSGEIFFFNPLFVLKKKL
jgi:hypothetical protein